MKKIIFLGSLIALVGIVGRAQSFPYNPKTLSPGPPLTGVGPTGSPNLTIIENTTKRTNKEQVYYYGPSKITLRGFLRDKLFYGPPGYGEHPSSDAKEPRIILMLIPPSSFRPLPNEPGTPEAWVEELQVFASSAPGQPELDLRPYINHHVELTGTAFQAENGHHHTRVLLEFVDIVCLDAVITDKKEIGKLNQPGKNSSNKLLNESQSVLEQQQILGEAESVYEIITRLSSREVAMTTTRSLPEIIELGKLIKNEENELKTKLKELKSSKISSAPFFREEIRRLTLDEKAKYNEISKYFSQLSRDDQIGVIYIGQVVNHMERVLSGLPTAKKKAK